jgi:hypothetical protein
VEGRSAEYATGDLLSEVLPEEDEDGEGEDEEADDSDSSGSSDGLDDFGDEELL